MRPRSRRPTWGAAWTQARREVAHAPGRTGRQRQKGGSTMACHNLSPAAQDLLAMPVIQTNLVSDGFVEANHIDPSLVNPWGVSHSATSPFWVSNAGTGTTTLYNGDGLPLAAAGHFTIAI